MKSEKQNLTFLTISTLSMILPMPPTFTCCLHRWTCSRSTGRKISCDIVVDGGMNRTLADASPESETRSFASCHFRAVHVDVEVRWRYWQASSLSPLVALLSAVIDSYQISNGLSRMVVGRHAHRNPLLSTTIVRRLSSQVLVTCSRVHRMLSR